MPEYYPCKGCNHPDVKFHVPGNYCYECEDKLAVMKEKGRIRREKIEIPKHRKALISALESIAESLHRIERAIVRAKENPR